MVALNKQITDLKGQGGAPVSLNEAKIVIIIITNYPLVLLYVNIPLANNKITIKLKHFGFDLTSTSLLSTAESRQLFYRSWCCSRGGAPRT